MNTSIASSEYLPMVMFPKISIETAFPQLVKLLGDNEILSKIEDSDFDAINRLLTQNEAMNNYPLHTTKQELLDELGRIEHGIFA